MRRFSLKMRGSKGREYNNFTQKSATQTKKMDESLTQNPLLHVFFLLKKVESRDLHPLCWLSE